MTPLGLLARLAPLIAPLIVATDRKIVGQLREAGSTDPATAIVISPPPPLGRLRLRRMVSVGAVAQIGDRYYLNEEGYAAWRVRRRTRALSVAAFVVVALGLLFALGVLG